MRKHTLIEIRLKWRQTLCDAYVSFSIQLRVALSQQMDFYCGGILNEKKDVQTIHILKTRKISAPNFEYKWSMNHFECEG